MTLRPAAPASRDAGMTLVEVMVALVLFAVLSTAVLSMVMTAQRATVEDTARVSATNLAVREIEIVRDTFASIVRGPDQVSLNAVTNASPLPGGRVGEPLVVDGIPFTVTRHAQWRDLDTAPEGSPCDVASGDPERQNDYLSVIVEVRWPRLGSRPPVRMETVMTPPKGAYSVRDGHIGLKVVDRNGAPVANTLVTAASSSGARQSGRTAGDGCVLLGNLPAGSYTITPEGAGYITPLGDPATDSAARIKADVQSRQLWRRTIEWDRAAALDVTFATRDGYGVPPEAQQLPVTLGNSALLPSGSRAVAGAGNRRTLAGLWPYASGYTMWAGSCAANNPGDVVDVPAQAPPGGTGTGTVRLSPVRVTLAAAVRVVATQSGDSGCLSGQSLDLGTVSGGQLLTSLPSGTWTFKRADGTGTSRTITLAPEPPPDPETPPTLPAVQTVSL